MTREEKIQKELDKLTREEKLANIRDLIYDWDIESLVDSVFSNVSENFDTLGDADFDDEYYEWVSHDLELLEDDEVEQPTKPVCDCPMTWGGIIHTDDCPDKKD